MMYSSFALSLLITLLSFSIGQARNPQKLIVQINHELEQADSPKTKSRLHIYRARQYTKMMQWDMALDDYNHAIALDHKGWIHLERSHLLMRMKDYDFAHEDATAAKEEVPTLSSEADKVIKKAAAEIQKKHEAENPVTILMDTQVDPSRKTRFDVMREQGAFAAKARTISNSSNTRRTASVRKTTSSSPRKSTS